MKRLIAAGLMVITALAFLLGTAGTAHAVGYTQAQRLALLQTAAQMTNNELRYLHTTWWEANFHYEVTDGLEVAVPAAPLAIEFSIRPLAETLYATAIMLANDKYDASVVGISETEASRRVRAWSNALAVSYDQYHWGEGWQSALWVYYWAFGAKQVWKTLPAPTRTKVTAAVAAEADRLLTMPPRYYRDAGGAILTPGDSKLEENAWNASLLYLAAKMFLPATNAAAWETQARRYLIAAYATPAQVGTDSRIAGSNLNADGTVTNHGIINVDYSTCHAEFAEKVLMVAKQTRSVAPWESRSNFALMWKALVRLEFDGGTIYRTREHGRPSADVYYPQGYAFSPDRRFNLAQMDVEAFLQRIDKQAYGWANAHLQFTLAQQARHEDGHTFAPGENLTMLDESFIAATGAEMVARLLYR